jgi:hypothetical protein
MSKTIVIKLKKAGNRINLFSISDNFGNILSESVTKKQLIQGLAFTISDEVTVIILTSLSKNCCGKQYNIPISTITQPELAAIVFQEENTSSLWRHLSNPLLYNNFYGCIHSYVIEYPFAYQYYDEIVQNVKDYTKVYKYLPTDDGVFNSNRKIQTDNDYFNKSVIYNDQQSSGVLELVAKPINNLKAYLSYPIFNIDSKTITFSKRDNFYQYNTFWDVVKDKTIPLFINSCESLSIDKEVNQDNMDYGMRSFKKYTIRAKDLKVRQILDNRSDVHLVSQFIITPSQISYL